MAKPLSVAEGCGMLWQVPMVSELTRIRYQVTVAADTELEAVSAALKELPYLTVDNQPLEYAEKGDQVYVDATKKGEPCARF